MVSSIVILLSLLFTSLQAEETISSPPVEATQQSSTVLSEALGHLVGQSIHTLGIQLDPASVVKGLQDALDGKPSPMTEAECIQTITAAQEAVFKKQSLENLKKAEEFLKQNAKSKEIVSLEEGMVQYRVEKKGKGDSVQPHFSPQIKYVGKFLDGNVFGSSKEAEIISLDETIAGFSQGLIGMKEGEKRTLFIHPKFGYGESGYLPPNSLLTFEIELVKANAAAEQEALSTSSSPTKGHEEIALPELDKPVLR